MALTNCPACNSQVSEQAVKCPKCGHPIRGKGEWITNANALIVVAGLLMTMVAWLFLPGVVGWPIGIGVGILVAVGAFAYASLRQQKGAQVRRPASPPPLRSDANQVPPPLPSPAGGWRSLAAEGKQVYTATASHTGLLIGYARAWLASYRLRKALGDSRFRLGVKAYQSGAGEPRLVGQIAALTTQINSPGHRAADQRPLKLERRDLTLRLADWALAQAPPPAGVEAECREVNDAEASLRAADDHLAALRKALFPPGGTGWRRVAIGYGAVGFLLLVVLISALPTGAPPLAGNPARSVGMDAQRPAEEDRSAEEEATRDAENRRRAFFFSTCPLRIEEVSLGRNEIGTPKIGFTVTNQAYQPIKAFEVRIACYTKFGDPVNAFGFGGNEKTLLDQDEIRGRPPHGDPVKVWRGWWLLHGQDTAKKFAATLTRVKMGDGTEWTPPAGFEEFNTSTYEFK
jgi:hypothetical protein